MAKVDLVDSSATTEADDSAAQEKRLTRSFYRHLIGSARFFAQRARAVEDRAQAQGGVASRSSEFVRHRAYVTGAILSAAAFLEASINELYLELHGVRGGERTRLPRRVLSVLGRFWSDIERAPVLHRYQVVLMVADAERFDERRAPFLEADSLMKLRDALVHLRPERPESRRRLRTIEQRLRNRFESSPLALADAAWFPDQCLSADCAEWAVKAADEFSEEFCKRMALPARGLSRYDANARLPRAREIERAVSVERADGDMPNEYSLIESGR